MKALFTVVLSVTALFSTHVLQAQSELPQPTAFSGKTYSLKYFDKYQKNSGFIQLEIGEKKLLRGENAFCHMLKKQLRGLPQDIYTSVNNKDGSVTVTVQRNITDPNDPAKEVWAKSTKTMTLKENSIDVDFTLEAVKELNFDQYNSNPVSDQFSFDASSIKGYTVEGRKGENLESSLVEVPFVKEHWSMNGSYDSLKVAGTADCATVTGTRNAAIRAVNYGGNGIEIYARYSFPKRNIASYSLKPGEKYSFSYTISFEKFQ